MKRFDFSVIMYTYRAKEKEKPVAQVIWEHVYLSSGIHSISTPNSECSGSMQSFMYNKSSMDFNMCAFPPQVMQKLRSPT